jgi:hypothetical protein
MILLQRLIIPIIAGDMGDSSLVGQPFELPLITLFKVLTYAALHFLIFRAYTKETAKEEPSKLNTIGLLSVIHSFKYDFCKA